MVIKHVEIYNTPLCVIGIVTIARYLARSLFDAVLYYVSSVVKNIVELLVGEKLVIYIKNLATQYPSKEYAKANLGNLMCVLNSAMSVFAGL